jgi:hypothetical protein
MEKHIKQSTARNRALAVLLLALSAILAGCVNLFEPIEPAVKAGAGTLSISIAGQGGGERTLYPDATFTKYELTFSEAGGANYGPKTITGKSTESFNDIPAGTWTITAVGYVIINGREYAAAEGVSDPVSTVAGQIASVSIAISAEQGGDPGFFSYDISFPVEKVDTARLTLSRFTGSSIHDDTQINSVDLITSSSGSVGSWELGSGLEPGYYRVDIVLQNDYQRAGISEIVHIYSNMETKAEYVYTEADFVDLVTLAGTVKVDGAALSDVWLNAFARLADKSIIDLGATYVTDGNWTLSIPAFSESTELYFHIGAGNLSVGNIPGIMLNPGETTVSNIALDLITLSGTVTVTINGEDPDSVFIQANLEEGDIWIGHTSVEPYSSGVLWNMIVPAFSAATTVSFYVEFSGSGGSAYEHGLSPTTVHNSAISDINLQVVYSSVTLSGTIGAVSVDTVTLSEGIRIIAYNQDGNSLGRASLNGGNGAWSMTMTDTTLASTDSIRFRVEIDTDGSNLYWHTPTTYPCEGQSIPDIALGNVSITTRTVGGTLANPPGGIMGASITALSERLESANMDKANLLIGDGIIEGGSWSLKVSSDAPASLWFAVVIYGQNSAQIYATNSASGAANVQLDINTMTLVYEETFNSGGFY